MIPGTAAAGGSYDPGMSDEVSGDQYHASGDANSGEGESGRVIPPPRQDEPKPKLGRRFPTWLYVVVGVAAFTLVMVGMYSFMENRPGSEEEWREAVEDRAGYTLADWDKYREAFVGDDGICKTDADDLPMLVAVFADRGTPAAELEMNFSYACPARLDDLRQAIAEVQDTSSRTDRVCSMDPALRTEDDQLYAEALGCD